MTEQTQELRRLYEEVERLSSRLEELDAVNAVRETLQDYAFYHDRGLSDQLAELFTADAELEIIGFGEGLDTKIEGREAIRNMYRQIDAGFDGPPPCKHVITNLRIDIHGHQAVA